MFLCMYSLTSAQCDALHCTNVHFVGHPADIAIPEKLCLCFIVCQNCLILLTHYSFSFIICAFDVAGFSFADVCDMKVDLKSTAIYIKV